MYTSLRLLVQHLIYNFARREFNLFLIRDNMVVRGPVFKLHNKRIKSSVPYITVSKLSLRLAQSKNQLHNFSNFQPTFNDCRKWKWLT